MSRILFAAFVFVSGASATLSSADAAPKPTVRCIAPPDGGCRVDNDCCAGSACFSGVCRVPEGETCTSSEVCAAGLGCIDDACQSECGEDGQTVDDPSYCCGGIAVDDVCDTPCIAPPDWGCGSDDDCCGDATCQVNGACRIPEGGACTGSESCVGGLGCVDGACRAACASHGEEVDDPAYCCEGSVFLDDRCETPCIAPPDWGCDSDDDCCGDATCQGNGVCRIPEGGACTSSESCVGGLGCVDGACQAACAGVGQEVDDSMYCCSGVSDGDVCVLPLDEPRCIEAYTFGCGGDEDCCAGTWCMFGVCTPGAVD